MTEQEVDALFWSAVDKNGPLFEDTPCYLWTGDNNKGYPIFKHPTEGRMPAQRYSWERANNSRVPRGWEVHHRCRRRACVNDLHVQPVSKEEHRATYHSRPDNRVRAALRKLAEQEGIDL